MTLARTALRLAALACLKGDDSGPTIAGRRVYDSRIDDLQPEAYADDAKPVVIVLTDSDEGDALSRQNGGPPFHRMIDLVFEIAMVQTVKDGDEFVIGYPDTDARHEASLDMLEFQIGRRLQYDLSAMPTLFRSFVRPRKHDCHRQVMDDGSVKVACRLLTWTCEVNDDQVIAYNTASTSPAVPTGFDVLPDPLKRVAKALTPGTAAYDVCAALAAALTPITAPPLRGFDMDVTPTVVSPNDLPQDT